VVSAGENTLENSQLEYPVVYLNEAPDRKTVPELLLDILLNDVVPGLVQMILNSARSAWSSSEC
jgi:hypothetical protein